MHHNEKHTQPEKKGPISSIYHLPFTLKSLGQNFCALPTLPFSHCRMRCSVATCVSAAATNNFLVSAQKGRNERAEKGEFPFTVIISDKVADRAENIHGDDEGARFVTREGPAQKGQAYRQVG